jgi:transposase
MKDQREEIVLAVDFSLNQLDVSLRQSDKRWVWPHRGYNNNRPGFQQLKQDLLTELSRRPGAQLMAVGESTGPYWWHAFYGLSHDEDLETFDPTLVVLNPARVKAYRKALPEEDKTDSDDPKLIDQYYRAVGAEHPYQFNDRYLRLRFLSRAYCRLIHTLASEKAYFRSVLYLVVSQYQPYQPFSNIFGATSQHILDEYVDIQAIADMPTAELVALLNKVSNQSFKDTADTARKLVGVVQDSYPLPPHLQETLHLILQKTLSLIRFLEDNKKAYEKLITQELHHLPEAQFALDIKGLGPILVAGFLSEIQDTRRFITGSKYDRKRKQTRPRTYSDGQAAVAKLAGLWWPKRSSGNFQAQNLHLSRERNTYLRYWFVQAAYTLQRYRSDYNAFYCKKYREATKNHHKRAIVLTARKSVRLVFALLHKGQRLWLKEDEST